jgi:membrane-associated PAP2 superfamily phosphatase
MQDNMQNRHIWVTIEILQHVSQAQKLIPFLLLLLLVVVVVLLLLLLTCALCPALLTPSQSFAGFNLLARSPCNGLKL